MRLEVSHSHPTPPPQGDTQLGPASLAQMETSEMEKQRQKKVRGRWSQPCLGSSPACAADSGDSGGPRVALEELWAQSCWWEQVAETSSQKDMEERHGETPRQEDL